jgi:hypothetical protein
MATQIFSLCAAHEWRAHLPDLGATAWPLLSRLAGGVTAWAQRGAPDAPAAGPAGVARRRPRAKSTNF